LQYGSKQPYKDTFFVIVVKVVRVLSRRRAELASSDSPWHNQHRV